MKRKRGEGERRKNCTQTNSEIKVMLLRYVICMKIVCRNIVIVFLFVFFYVLYVNSKPE